MLWRLVFLGAVVVAGCATVPSGPLKEGEVRVGRLVVPESVRPGPYTVTFEAVEKEKADIVFQQACFIWQTSAFSDGPYCFTPQEDAAAKTATVGLSTRNPNTYTLYGTLRYTYKGQPRESNTARAVLSVR